MGVQAISNQYLFLCEGPHDKAFLEHLREKRGLPSFQCEAFGDVAGADNNGIDMLTQALDALPALTGFESIKRILIVADNDTSPSDSFKKVCDLIGSAGPLGNGAQYGVPQRPQTYAGTGPEIIVLMLPWTDEPGALETLCYQASMNACPKETGCVEEFAKCSNIESWESPTKIAKMKLHSLIAVFHKRNPGLTPRRVWDDIPKAVPLEDTVFDNIANFLQGTVLV